MSMRSSLINSQYPVKAAIFDEDKEGANTDPVAVLMFNPEEYTVKKTNKYNTTEQADRDIPLVSFGGGGTTTFSLSNLVFDTYGKSPVEDVRAYTSPVFELMKIVPNLGRPKKVSFRWKGGYFRAVILGVSQTLTMFLADGTPVRAKLSIDFQVVEEGTDATKGTNPTSIAQSYKIRTVHQGETIDVIAYQEYGDSSRWPLIAETNRLENPMRLHPGQRLAIPPLA